MSLTDDLLPGAAAAAKYLGLDRGQIYRLVASGELPAIRKLGRLYFRKSELEAAFRSEPSAHSTVRDDVRASGHSTLHASGAPA